MGFDAGLKAHLETGATTVARAWEIERTDGERLGFTDHDEDLSFEGLVFRAEAGMTAQVLATATGLSVDNTEAIGALSADAITEEDIGAGRYDGARVRAWLVNWRAPGERVLQFNGTIGEIMRDGGQFRAELRGLSEALNTARGHVYQAPCAAVLGDGRCGVDSSAAAYSVTSPVAGVEDGHVFRFAAMPQFADGWFTRGRLTVVSGAAAGLEAVIKRDATESSERVAEVWEELGAAVAPGDQVRLEAGCDKTVETCRVKFDNFLNFRGFPDIPGDDWLAAVPRKGEDNSGGSRRYGGS